MSSIDNIEGQAVTERNKNVVKLNMVQMRKTFVLMNLYSYLVCVALCYFPKYNAVHILNGVLTRIIRCSSDRAWPNSCFVAILLFSYCFLCPLKKIIIMWPVKWMIPYWKSPPKRCTWLYLSLLFCPLFFFSSSFLTLWSAFISGRLALNQTFNLSLKFNHLPYGEPQKVSVKFPRSFWVCTWLFTPFITGSEV